MRILVIRIGRAGDIIMTTPALRALINTYPEARFNIITSPDGKRLLSNFDPAIEEIWVWNRSGLQNYFDKRNIAIKLKRTHFDMVFCFDTGNSIQKLVAELPSKIYLNTSKDKTIHSAQTYLDMVSLASKKTIEFTPAQLHLNNDAETSINEELSALGIHETDIVIMLHPTFSGMNKISFGMSEGKKHRFWPTEKFCQLGDKLASISINDSVNPKVIVDLIPEESSVGDFIKKHSSYIQVITGPPNFERYKALVKRADLFISPNTGPMHIAAAMGTPVVALFSKWNPHDCGPFMPKEKYIVLRAEDTDTPELGLSAIEVDNVLNASVQMLTSH